MPKADPRTPSRNPMDIELEIRTADPIHVQIQRQLEQSIRSGRLAPGQRLPPTAALVRKWGVTCATIQRAMDQVAAADLIERKPGRGTFVRSTAEKAVIGLLVGPDLLDEDAHFFRAVVRAIQQETKGRGWRCLVYDQLSYVNEEAVAQHRRRLLQDLQHHRFKGLLIVGCSPPTRRDFLRHANLPHAAYGFPMDEVAVCWDTRDFIHASVTWLAAQRCRRIVYLRTASRQDTALGDLDALKHLPRELGRPAPTVSVCHVEKPSLQRDFSRERQGYQLMGRLAEDWNRTGLWPEGLMVGEDILMRGVAQALTERKDRASRHLKIVCMCTEGIEHLYAVPVMRYEHSAGEIARHLVSILWRTILGEAVPQLAVRIKGKLVASK